LGSSARSKRSNGIASSKSNAGAQIPTTALLDVAVRVIDVRVIETVVLASSVDAEDTGLEPEPLAKAVIPPSCGPTFPSAILARQSPGRPTTRWVERGWKVRGDRLCANTVSGQISRSGVVTESV
jgi:hypothetical protein